METMNHNLDAVTALKDELERKLLGMESEHKAKITKMADKYDVLCNEMEKEKKNCKEESEQLKDEISILKKRLEELSITNDVSVLKYMCPIENGSQIC